MTTRKERLIHAHCDGLDYTFVRANRISYACFGGPLDQEVTGLEHGPRKLHSIGYLSARAIPALGGPTVLGLPLVYGMCFNGCDITYRLSGYRKIEVLGMSQRRSLEDWPYAGFPDLLPYVPLVRATATPRSYADFAKRFPNLPDRPEGQLMVCVPPPATIGLSLWGEGDLEGVTIVFDCDLTTGTVHAYNVTT
jgi:hypothetical protein